MRAIEFKNVSFRYEDMPEPVLKNASFSLEYGRLALLYGDSGQGKSTVLSILSGVIPNVTKGTLSGEVRIGGEDVSGQRISNICRRAGVVLQNADAQIIHQRVEDELAFGCENFAFSPEKIGGCIEKACDRMALCPQWGTRTLSGGQKQQLITASALATEQKILLLDEPLANLDRKGAAFLMSSLRTLAESGYAVLIVEHRLEQVLPFAHEVWRLRNGSLERQTGRESLRTAQPEAAVLIPAEGRREEPVMTLRGVGWRAGGRSILEGVDLNIFRGERLLLLGDNGCGKTSLLRLMARLARPTAGEIRQFIDPALGQRRGSRAWFRRVGVVYQNPNCQLFMPTVAQEVAFAAKSEDFAREIMELFGIAHLAERHPHSLSEGQKRRVSIAAVAASQPELLLLDEHTAALDPKTADKVLALSDQIVQENNLTTLMITHNMKDAIAHGNRLIMMDAGRVVVDISGEDKKKLTVPDLLALFSRASGSDEANDKMLLS